VRYTRSLAGVLLVLLVSACGGGGGESFSSTPTDPDQSFSLSLFNSTKPGLVYATNLTGSDTNGNSFVGSFSVANRAQEMLGGSLVTPQDALLYLDSGTQSLTVTATNYTDDSGLFVFMEVQTTGLECTPVSPDSLPSSVKIGDSGVRSPQICNDNTTTEVNWRVEDAGNGNIDFIETDTDKDQSNTILQVTEVAYTLDGAGEIVRFTSSSRIVATGYTQSLESA
jgi:hypothetical protein